MDTPIPDGGIRLYWYLLKNHFPKILFCNVLLLVFSIPVVTLPAAICGVNRVYIKLIRDKYVFVWKEFWGEFRQNFWKSLVIGIIIASLLGWVYVFVAETVNSAGIVDVLSIIIKTIIIAFVPIFSAYALVLLPMIEIPFYGIMKNAILLIPLGLKISIMIWTVLVGSFYIAILFFPFSLFPILLIAPSIVQYSVAFLAIQPIEKWIVSGSKNE